MKHAPQHEAINCEVIAAPRNLSDISFSSRPELPVALQITLEDHMPNYPIHTLASSPAGSKSALEQLQHAFGVIPNLVAAIANSPKLINSLVGVFQQVHSSSLTEPEIQIVLLTDAVANFRTDPLLERQGRMERDGIGGGIPDHSRARASQ